MKRIDAHTHRCMVCNAVFWSRSDEEPRVLIKAHSGQPVVRVISVGREEVHRCTLTHRPRAARQ